MHTSGLKLPERWTPKERENQDIKAAGLEIQGRQGLRSGSQIKYGTASFQCKHVPDIWEILKKKKKLSVYLKSKFN